MEQVFEKTEFGRMVIDNRIEGMSHKARRLLILIDGKRTAAMVSTLSGLGHDFIDHLHHLIDNGLIRSAVATSESLSDIATDTASPETPALVQPVIVHPEPIVSDTTSTEILPENFEAIKQWMADSSRQYLGLMGKTIINKIESANTLASLRSCTAPWITALRDSKNGAMLADMYLAQVNQQLGVAEAD